MIMRTVGVVAILILLIYAIIPHPPKYSSTTAITSPPPKPTMVSLKAEEPAPDPNKQWQYETDEDEMGRGTKYFASIFSINTVNFSFPYQGSQHARLLLRQTNGVNEILFSIQQGQLLCQVDSCAVLVRFDKDAPILYPASEPSDHKTTVLFINNTEDFIARLVRSSSFKIQKEVYQEGSPVFEFDSSLFDYAKFDPTSTNLSRRIQSQTNEPTSDTRFNWPSWCNKAKTPSEKAICSDQEIAKLSNQLTSEWKYYKQSYSDNDVSQKKQQLKDFNKNKTEPCKGDKDCLKEAFTWAVNNLF